MEEIILEYYNEYNFPSASKLYQILRKNNIDVKVQDVRDFVARQVDNQLLKVNPEFKKHQGHITSFIPNEVWQIDLFDLSKYNTTNNSYKWIFACVDVFTRRAYC